MLDPATQPHWVYRIIIMRSRKSS